MNLPNISIAYSILNELNNQFDSPVLNPEGLNEEIRLGDKELFEDITRFNNLVQELKNNLTSDDREKVQGMLIKLRIKSMHLSTIFDRLADELMDIIKAR
jgi:hypothetical protein